MKDTMFESKSILAKLMATENIHIEEQNVDTASFDVESRVLTVPVLDKEITGIQYDLFMGHEVGHALYTPLEGLKKMHELKLSSGVCNVLEDVRIEKRIKNKYPGLRNSFVKAYRQLYDNDFFGTLGAELQQMNFIDRVNLHTKVGTNLGIKFNEFERELLREIDSTETYDDVLVVARKVMDYMEEESKKQKEQNQNLEESDESEDGDDTLEMDFGNDETEDNQEEQFDEGMSKSWSKQASDEQYDDVLEDAREMLDEAIRSFTDEAYSKNQKQMFETSGRGVSYVNIPKVDLESVVLDYKQYLNLCKLDGATGSPEEFIRIRNSNNKVVSYLVKEFEMRKNAQQQKRASIAKTGELNMNKIFSYQFSEDVFKKMTIVPDGKSHGLVLFLDWSGSMSLHIQHTVKQLFALTTFCKKVNIPFEVYAFVDNRSFINNGKQQYKKNDVVLNNFILVNILSSRMSAMDYSKAGALLTCFSMEPKNYYKVPAFMGMAGTPLNESIIAAFELIPQFKERYNLQIVNTVLLTDGQGHALNGKYIDDNNIPRINAPDGYTSDVVFCDPVTKQQVKIPHKESLSGDRQTGALLKLLKDRTGANVMGFYILRTADFDHEARRLWPATANFDALKAEFRTNKYSIAKSIGFDEYYLLKSEKKNLEDDDGEFESKSTTTRGLVSAFKKYTGGKVSNKVVLNRFIGLIA